MNKTSKKSLLSWWRSAGSAAQLGAVVAVVAAVLGAAVAVAQPFLNKDPEGPNLASAVVLPPVHNGCGSSWIVAGPVGPDTFAPRDVPRDGTLVSGSSLQVVLQETTGRTVVLHSMRVKVVDRAEPAAGVHLEDTGCGGYLPISYLSADLNQDDAVPVLRPTAETGGAGLIRPPFPWTVAENDPVAYAIQLDVTNATVRFVVVVHWSWGDQRRETTIDNGGKPFVVSSTQRVTDRRCNLKPC